METQLFLGIVLLFCGGFLIGWNTKNIWAFVGMAALLYAGQINTELRVEKLENRLHQCEQVRNI